jgi:5-methylcytosine-specific restriction endonuclease McrA
VKHCSKCGEQKPHDCFSTNTKAKDGLHSWCRNCVNEQRKEKREQYAVARRDWDAANKEKIAAKDASRRLTPKYKLMKSASDKKYRAQNAVSIKVRKQAYYAEHPELRRAEYQRNKQGYVARAYARLRKIKCLTPPDADKAKLIWFYEEAKRLTKLTGVKHEVDHIIPVSKGGLHHQDNLQVLPWLENRNKGAKIMDMRSKK